MIENLTITKTGNEADNQARTLFSSSTPWESGGINLLVYKNGSLQIKPTNYSVLSNTQIQLSSSISTTDKISMIITKYIDNINTVDIDRVAKKVEGKTQTSVTKAIYEETIPSNFIIHTDDIWSSDIPNDIPTAISVGVAFEYNLFTLTEDVTVNNQKGWYASSNGQLTGRIVNWIPPKFGQAFTLRLYDANNTEIVSSDTMKWKWDYQSGYLFIENTHSYTTPFKIKGYQYVGSFGSGGSGVISHWKAPVLSSTFLPLYGNQQGDARLVLDTNIIYRWDNIGQKWISTAFGSARFKNPVANFGALPTTGNIDGDFRLVLDVNSIYRWNSSTTSWEDIVNNHDHSDLYYEKTYLDNEFANKAPLAHSHHSLYYQKNEVDSMVRWRPSRATEADLPPYTENREGDVILTRDTNTIWRFDFSAGPQGEWIPITFSTLTWKNPVQMIGNLSTTDNSIGDVHLVIEEGQPYWWDGTQWIQFYNTDHNHDDRYYSKDEIDVMVRWKPPVTDFVSLPIIDNVNGDIRLTLDNNNVYRWNGTDWKLISASPLWREPVNTLFDLPTIGNRDGDTRIVKDTRLLYQWDASGSIWISVANPPHDHDDRYFTQTELLTGAIDGRYYTETEIDTMFSPIIGHNHDGINSRPVNYDDLANIPYLYWKNPVINFSSLPGSGNTTGDVRIVLNNSAAYFWNGYQWAVINEGLFALQNHNHDDCYYTETEINTIITNLETQINIQLAQKADLVHTHNDLYYLKLEVDNAIQSRFDIASGHDHDGTNSKRISYYDLDNIPGLAAHDHDDLYYRKTELQTSGESEVHWDNIISKPDLANSNWKSPVQTVADLPPTGNSVGDIRLVLDDSDIYEWNGAQWVLIGHWDNQYVAYWREPVDSYDDLPATNNVDGDVRITLDKNILYRWKSDISRWVNVSLSNIYMQVYLNGLNLLENLEWVKLGDRSFELLVHASGGDKVTLIILGEIYLRRDFIAYEGQDFFEIVNKYHRQDYIITSPKLEFILDTTYILGGANLLVWQNGLLQTVNKDYFEKTNNSFQFYNAIPAGNRVTAIILEQASGEGDYIREDQDAISGQTLFSLNNFFIPGTNQLLVYLNGHLLKVDDDYLETSNSTIVLNTPCNEACTITFIIFEAGGGGSGGCCNAADVILGLPSDGQYDDGLLDLFEQMKVNEAVDEINEALLDLAPPSPLSLSGTLLVPNGLNLVSGFISAGNTYIENSAGDYHNYLTENNSFLLNTTNATIFKDADKGVLDLYVNETLLDTFRLYSAFVESDAGGNQTALNYGIQANGARENEGVPGTNGAIRNSTNSYISIMSIGIYNNFKRWQIGSARINIIPTLLRQGYNYVRLVHRIDTDSRTTQTLKFFYDNAGSRPSLSSTVGCLQETLISTKYLSGVRYYSLGDTFRIAFSAFNIFNNTYSPTPAKIDMSGIQSYDVAYDDPNISGPNSPPQIGDFFDFNGILLMNDHNEYSIDARALVSTFDPFGSGATNQSSSVHRLVNTYSMNISTNLTESFLDEFYRLPDGNYNSPLTQRTGLWNSETSLQNGQALIYDQKLKYANINFSAYKPTQALNYSTFTGLQTYYRSFYKNVPKNNGTFILRGITIQELTTGQLLIDLKIPGVTGWLSLNTNYDIVTFTGSDGDGCFLNYDGGEQFTYSSGTFSTASSGYTIVLRITIPNSSAPELEYIELLW